MSDDIDTRLERIQWDLFWLPATAAVVDRPEILYSSDPQGVLPLNQVIRTRAPRARLPALINEVKAAHAGGTSRWQIFSSFEPDALAAALSCQGYQLGSTYHGHSISTRGHAATLNPAVRVRRVDDVQTLNDAIEVVERAFGVPYFVPKTQRQQHLAEVHGEGVRAARFVAYMDGEAVSSAGLSLYASEDLGYLWGGATLEHARGRGAYTALVAARLAYCAELGVSTAGIYAQVDTSAPILQKLGFTRHAAMQHWNLST